MWWLAGSAPRPDVGERPGKGAAITNRIGIPATFTAAAVATWIGIPAWVIALVVMLLSFFGGARLLLTGSNRDDVGRARLASWAEVSRAWLTRAYNVGPERVLGLLDRLAQDGYLERTDDAGMRGVRSLFRVPPWSPGLYNLTLLLAFAYPLLFLFGGWVWSGQTMAGLDGVMPPNVNAGRRVLAAFLIGFIMVSLLSALSAVSGRRWFSWFLYLINTCGGVLLLSDILTFSGAATLPAAVAIMLTLAFVVALTGARAREGALDGFMPITAAFCLFLVTATSGIAHHGLIIFVFFIFCGALCCVFFVLRNHRIPHKARYALYLLQWISLVFFSFALMHVGAFGDAVSLAAGLLIILLLILLLLANAPLDWLSIGLTRGLLRTGLALGGTWRIALISLLDLALAAALMLALVALTVAMVAAANGAAAAGGGAPILPIAPLLDALTADPWAAEFAWIWLMLFSTLLPSLLHLLAGLVSLAVTCMLWVCDSTVAAKAFVLGETAADRTKDTMFTIWYPAGAAAGCTGLVGLGTAVLHGWPVAGDAAAWFAGLLLGVARATAALFPGG